jgi:hypothetical protein
MTLGGILAFPVLVAAVVLALMSRMDGIEAAMFAALSLAILVSGISIPWRVPA